MDREVPSWRSLAKRYRDENLRYLSDNKNNLYKIMIMGILAAAISVFLSFLSLPGTIYSYYLILIFLIASFGPTTNDKGHPFHISLSIGMSSVMISIILGLYILMYYNGDLGLLQSLISISTTSLSIIFILPIYGILISLFGVVSMDVLSKLFNFISKNKNKSDNKSLKDEDRDDMKDKTLQKEKNC